MGVREGTISVDGYQSGIAVWAVAASHCCSCTADLAQGMITWSRSKRERLTA